MPAIPQKIKYNKCILDPRSHAHMKMICSLKEQNIEVFITEAVMEKIKKEGPDFGLTFQDPENPQHLTLAGQA